MVSIKERFWGEWNRLKNGRNEVNLIINTINFILLISMRYSLKVNLINSIIISTVILIVLYMFGYYATNNILPESNRINPFSQDNINSAIYLQQSLIYFYEYIESNDVDKLEKAKREMENAQNLRLKWLK